MHDVRVREEPCDPPSHPALRILANCEQVLSSHTSRRLIVMEKISGRTEEGAEAEGITFESSAEFRNHVSAEKLWCWCLRSLNRLGEKHLTPGNNLLIHITYMGALCHLRRLQYAVFI